jgi:hypothetical protein
LRPQSTIKDDSKNENENNEIEINALRIQNGILINGRA